jgi:WD40 repeat protein
MNAERCLPVACCLFAAMSLVIIEPRTLAQAQAPDPAEAAGEQSDVSFQSDIAPILSQHCYGCHQGAKQLGSYRMTDFDSLIAGGESERAAIVPGKPDESYLIELITPVDGHAEMPDEPFQPLQGEQVELIRRWVAQGAKNDSPETSASSFDAAHPPVYAGPPPLPSVDVSPDGTRLAVAGYHEVLLLDARTGAQQSRWIGMSPRINTVRFSPDGTRLAAVGGTPAVLGELQIWDVQSGELALSRTMTYDSLCGASWSPDGSKLAFGASDNVVRAIDTATGEQILYQGAHEDWVRDTAFTPDGKHVISVARDMSCKLTEVETERFIDNITSITPGALSGGLSSVVAHPQRNEILVGGADGIAKVYRVFRETARKIGDDSNLVRNMPKMPGRIFSVAISRDASRLAAASTLDGNSEVRVWHYDFTSELSGELKAMLEKRVGELSPEENAKVEQYRNSEVKEVFRFPLDQAAVFAIAFAEDSSLIVAAADGNIRRLDPAGQLVAEFPAVAIDSDSRVAAAPFDARAWNEMLTQRIEASAAETPPPVDQVKELIVEPPQVELTSPYAYAQLLVTAVLQDGSTVDVTRLSELEVPAWATITAEGLVRGAGDGSGTISLHYGNHSQAIQLAVSGVGGDAQGAVDYIRDVNPILSRLGCNAGTCHGAQKGKNGFKLSLRGYDAVFDLRALTDDLAARRINPADPEQSLMLRKPLGLTPHQGGALMTAGDPNHTVLRRWIADGCELNQQSPRVQRIEVFPLNPIVQSVSSRQQVRVVAHYADGVKRDVTREAFIESGNSEVATAGATGLLTAVRRGEAPILARYEGAYAATTLTVMGDRTDYQPVQAETWGRIDELVAEKWQRVKVVPSPLCDDATFLRRVHLDLTGMPPSSDQVREFLADATPTRLKRARVIDQLIGSEAYIDFWTNKWADLLQVNRKFLGVEGSAKFRDWIRQAVAENRPYDQFARQVLTASGSNNENPPASYFKVLRTPEDTMENTTHLFLGIRFNCNKCHDHPFERWTQDQYYHLSAYFAQVGLENDPASGDRKVGGTAVEDAKPLFEKVVDKDAGDVAHPRTGQPVPPAFPYEVPLEGEPAGTRRAQLAQWISDANNPYFARSYVNRLWGYLLGVGLIEPIDDIRAGNPATNPELLQHLTESFVGSGFDVQQMHRQICNSRTYQLSVATNPLNEDDSLNYSHALPRRLPAEVIYDAVHAVTGAVSTIPGVPQGTRAAALTDSGIELPDGFLQNLGRPARESACECERSSDLQLGPVMALISGPTIGSAIADPKNELERITQQFSDDSQLAEEIFLRALGRQPSEAELNVFAEMKQMITSSHEELVAQLQAAEQDWQQRRLQLEQQREQRLAEVVQQIAARSEAIKPEREQLAAQREQRIKEAQQVVDQAKAKLEQKIDSWAAQLDQQVEWFPLSVASASATNQAVLTPQADRSIVASGNKQQGVYTIKVHTTLSQITGFRLEALSDPKLPSSGPGLAPNGNFVLTEFEVSAASAKTPQQTESVKIASGVADFLQDGFAIEQTFDGQKRGQQGWAVHGAAGLLHWATYKLEKPISHDEGTVLTFKLHQFHDAAEHTLGRFRISATTAKGDIPLGHAEPIAAALATAKEHRSAEDSKLLADYLSVTDGELRAANQGLAAANAPLPADTMLATLEQRKAELSNPTPDDPLLVQLRQDARQSTQQLANPRLTAAEDLTWALINSPAFLFNH